MTKEEVKIIRNLLCDYRRLVLDARDIIRDSLSNDTVCGSRRILVDGLLFCGAKAEHLDSDVISKATKILAKYEGLKPEVAPVVKVECPKVFKVSVKDLPKATKVKKAK